MASCPESKFISFQTRRDQGGSSARSRVEGLSRADRERYFLAFPDERYAYEKDLELYHISRDRIERWEKSTGVKVARDSKGNVRFDQDGVAGGFYLSEASAAAHDALLDEERTLFRLRTDDGEKLFANFVAFNEAMFSSIQRFQKDHPGTLEASPEIPDAQLRDNYNYMGSQVVNLHWKTFHAASLAEDLAKAIAQDTAVMKAAEAARELNAANVVSLPELNKVEFSQQINLGRYAAAELKSAMGSLGF